MFEEVNVDEQVSQLSALVYICSIVHVVAVSTANTSYHFELVFSFSNYSILVVEVILVKGTLQHLLFSLPSKLDTLSNSSSPPELIPNIFVMSNCMLVSLFFATFLLRWQ